MTDHTPMTEAEIDEARKDGMRWVNFSKKLVVIASVSLEEDGRVWLHLSISHAKRMADYDEIRYLKEHWGGPTVKAVEVHPPDVEHININPMVRHLWICLEADPLPDFTRGRGSI